jgi:hypothetical protein
MYLTYIIDQIYIFLINLKIKIYLYIEPEGVVDIN